MRRTSPANVRAQALSEVPFEFVNARLRGRRSRFYEGARLRELTRERTVEDLAWRLFPGEEVSDPSALERRMLSACAAELDSVTAYLAGPQLALVRALLDRYAVENLKVLLRLFAPEGQGADPAAHLIDLPPALSLPVEELAGSGGVEGFIARIPLGTVRECAQQALPLYGETGRRAYLEMAFDKGYWTGVREALEGLPPGERRQCSAPVACEFDAMGLLGTLRASSTYGIPWEQWETLLPAGWGRISRGQLRRIHANPELGDVVESLPWLQRVLGDSVSPDEAPDLGRLEEALWHEAVRLANRQYYEMLAGPAVLVSYFYLKREELRHLLALTQMLRYGEGEAQIVEYLGV